MKIYKHTFSCNCIASDLSERVMVSGQDHALFSGKIAQFHDRNIIGNPIISEFEIFTQALLWVWYLCCGVL